MTTIRFENHEIADVRFPGAPEFVGSWVLVRDAEGNRVALPEGRIRSVVWDDGGV